MKMTFGKYRGDDIKNLPADYLTYISAQDWFKNIKINLRRAICEQLGIPVVYKENPYKRNFGGVAKSRSIMDRNLKKDLDFDDFNERKKN